MYVQLVEDANWRSPVLYIHCDEEETLQFINQWLKELIAWVLQDPRGGMPLQRLDVNTAMVDLTFKLGQYYFDTMPDQVAEAGYVQSWLRLFNESKIADRSERIYIINLKEELNKTKTKQ